MILTDDLVEFLRPELVGERPRRILVESRSGERTRAAGFRPDSPRTGPPAPAEYGGNSLTVTDDHNAPGPVLRLAQAVEVLGLCDAFAIDLLDDVAALESQIAGIGTVVHVDDHHAFISIAHLQLVDERRRKIGDFDPRKRRARPDDNLLAWRVWRDLQGDSHCLLVSGAHDAEARGAAERLGCEAIVESVGVLDVLTVDRHDKIAGLERSACRRAVRRDIRDQRTGRTFEPHAVG